MKTKVHIDRRRLLGYVAGITAGVSYGMNPLFGKALMESGVPVMVMLFFRYGFAAVFTAILILARKEKELRLRERLDHGDPIGFGIETELVVDADVEI